MTTTPRRRLLLVNHAFHPQRRPLVGDLFDWFVIWTATFGAWGLAGKRRGPILATTALFGGVANTLLLPTTVWQAMGVYFDAFWAAQLVMLPWFLADVVNARRGR